MTSVAFNLHIILIYFAIFDHRQHEPSHDRLTMTNHRRLNNERELNKWRRLHKISDLNLAFRWGFYSTIELDLFAWLSSGENEVQAWFEIHEFHFLVMQIWESGGAYDIFLNSDHFQVMTKRCFNET